MDFPAELRQPDHYLAMEVEVCDRLREAMSRSWEPRNEEYLKLFFKYYEKELAEYTEDGQHPNPHRCKTAFLEKFVDSKMRIARKRFQERVERAQPYWDRWFSENKSCYDLLESFSEVDHKSATVRQQREFHQRMNCSGADTFLDAAVLEYRQHCKAETAA